ncbi:LOB domain-containing protein 36-like [Olea europaea var. sylvestris]|uniref:LOB domain-containing protein 36-like n=1 Tax=Olea europaea var. sylvestris TaxID=158386 RepID=UPI000C1CD419|nr:LOB domain-containing protein 36-like [Olea europaea var. sylvestris]
MSSTTSPCAACKFLRRKCTLECVFAPYFSPDNPQKFANVHEVFGASKVAKLLNELNASQREDAVNSLAYEAEYRLCDPVYGCVGLISTLQHKLRQVHNDLATSKKELATYIGPAAMLPMLNLQQQYPNYGASAFQAMPYNMQPMMAMPTGVSHSAQLMIRDPHQQQQILNAQQMAAVTYEPHQHQQQDDLVRYNGGFDNAGGPVIATGFAQISDENAMPPPSSSALGSYENNPLHHIQQEAQDHSHSHQLQLEPQPHEFFLQQQPQENASPHHHLQQLIQLQPEEPQASHSQPRQQQRARSEEGRSVNPSC